MPVNPVTQGHAAVEHDSFLAHPFPGPVPKPGASAPRDSPHDSVQNHFLSIPPSSGGGQESLEGSCESPAGNLDFVR